MKKTLALSATLLTLLVATTAQAQPVWPGDGLASDRVDRRVETMTEQLDLTAEQQAEIRTILEAQQAKRQQQRAAVRQQVDSVLTEKQRATRDAEVERRIERRVARIADRLDLTPQQETALKTLMVENRESPSLSQNERRERLATVLTDDQLAQLEQMRSRHGHRPSGGCKN